MPPTLVHLIRHGQGEHQLEPTAEHAQIPDAPLTDLGKRRCHEFGTRYPRRDACDLLVASPLRRAIQTAQLCFDVAATPRLTPILLQPDAQEDSDLPSDTPSSPEALRELFGDGVDTSLLVDGAYVSQKGKYAPTPDALRARARSFRHWLRERKEREIVCVGHGRFWAYVVGEMDAKGKQTGPYWMNRCWRSFEFVNKDDGDAFLRETQESIQRRDDNNADLSR